MDRKQLDEKADQLESVLRAQGLTLATLCDLVLGEDATDRSDEALIRAVGEFQRGHDRVVDQMNEIVKQTRQERDVHKVAVQELLIACRDLLAYIVNKRIDFESSNFKTAKQARKHVETHPLGIESAARKAIDKYLDTYPVIDVSLVENALELRTALQRLRDWCDEYVDGIEDDYKDIMRQCDTVLLNTGWNDGQH